MSTTSIYPPSLVLLPIQVLERLPPSIQSIELEGLMVVHCVLSLIPSFFSRHPSYSLPLSLASLLSTHPTLISLLPHMLCLWLFSVLLDIVWLIYKTDLARALVVFCVGAGLVLKVVSAGLMARVARTEGYVGEGGLTAGPGGRFGLPGGIAGAAGGLWTRTTGQAGDSLPGGYASIYDDEEEATGGREATQEASHTHR